MINFPHFTLIVGIKHCNPPGTRNPLGIIKRIFIFEITRRDSVKFQNKLKNVVRSTKIKEEITRMQIQTTAI